MRKSFLALLLLLVPFSLLAEDQATVESVTKTLVWPDGTRYVGGVVDGKRSGKGTIFWQDGTRFVGQFEDDMRNGTGTMILPDGTVYTGFFKDDELVDSPAASTIAAADPADEPVESESSSSEAQIPVSDIPEPEETEPEVATAEEPSEEPAANVLYPVEGSEEEAPVEAMIDSRSTTLEDDVKQQLMGTVDLWKSAWSDKNVPQYFSYYSDDFQVPGKLTRNSWEAFRRSRLTRPQYINLDIVYEKFEMVETNVADVFFKQIYRSNLYNDETEKVLRLRKDDQVWKILVERSR